MSTLTTERRALRARPRPCRHCGKTVTRFYALFCSTDCYTAHRRPKDKRCKMCRTVFTPLHRRRDKLILLHTKKCCSDECLRASNIRNMRNARRLSGAEHYNWSGGKWWGQHDWRGEGWTKIRNAVRARARYRCEKCGIPEAELTRECDVHHRIPFHNFTTAKEANRMSNLEACCHSCHMVAEAELRLTSGAQMTLALTGDIGHAGRARGERVGGAKCTTLKALAIKRALEGTEPRSHIARRLKISAHIVNQIASGKTWKHLK